MAEEGGVEMLVRLLAEPSDTVQRQAAKALANLGVHKENKIRISSKGAVPPLIGLIISGTVSVQIEAVAALANLAVNGEDLLTLRCGTGTGTGALSLLCMHNAVSISRVGAFPAADANEKIIAEHGGIEPIVKRATEAVAGTLDIPSTVAASKATAMRLELQSQCARALRNLSVRGETAMSREQGAKHCSVVPVANALSHSRGQRSAPTCNAPHAADNLCAINSCHGVAIHAAWHRSCEQGADSGMRRGARFARAHGIRELAYFVPGLKGCPEPRPGG